MGSTGCASISNLNFVRNRTHNCFDQQGPIRNRLGSVRVHHSRRLRPELSVLRIWRSFYDNVLCYAVDDDLREKQQEFGAGPGVGSSVEERPSTDLVDGVKDNEGSSISNFLYPGRSVDCKHGWGRVNDGRNSSVLSALLQNQRSSEPLDSLFLSGSSTSSSTHFLGSRSMVSFEDVREERGSNKSLFHQYEHEDNREDDLGEYLHQPGKKRRLTAGQVQFLKKSFDVENKLEPERKVLLTKDLGLQPRQVAIWFQNRRARWKTKHLEKDYEVLQANYNNLKANCESLSKENDKLKAEQRQAAGKSEAGKIEAWIQV